MLVFLAVLLWLFLSFDHFSIPAFTGQRQPDLIHLSPADDLGTIVVTWSTREDTCSSIVQYGICKSSLSQEAIGASTVLPNELCLIDTVIFRFLCYKTVYQYVHKVAIKNLQSDTTYYYRCGSNKSWSEVFHFTTVPEGNDWSLKMILYGDLGTESDSTKYLIRESKTGEWRMFLHLGDLAYNLETYGGAVGDNFLRQIQPIAAYYPYLVAVGNHERYRNFSNYKIRFQMPGDADNFFYSYKIGPLLLVAVSTEAYYEEDDVVRTNQIAWLEKTLKEANEPANRTTSPWILVGGHRPMYCSTTIAQWCPNSRLQEAFEDLFYKYGVDVVFWGHVHAYERTYPLYKGKVMKSEKSPYVNPKAPIHFVSGSAGSFIGQFLFLVGKPDFIAYRSRDVGYTRLTFHNSTDLYVEQVSVDEGGKVIDSILIHKDDHSPPT